MHEPLMTQILPGELRVQKGDELLHLAVGEGFLEVTQERVSVLTDMAIKESDIDENAVEAAIRRAEASLKEEKMAGEELAAVQASLQKSLAQLRVKRRRRH
jgi:F-type H+-transporting ATPase subunit epsilon